MRAQSITEQSNAEISLDSCPRCDGLVATDECSALFTPSPTAFIDYSSPSVQDTADLTLGHL